MSYRKDSTISSKMSEYDNVPILPSNYYNHQYKDHDELLVSSSPNPKIMQSHEKPRAAPRYHSFPVDDAPPVPPHQVPLVHNQTHLASNHLKNSLESNHSSHEASQKPSAFPLEQEDYDSLDARLVMQHRKQKQLQEHLKQQKQLEQQQQHQQKPQQKTEETQTQTPSQPLPPKKQASPQREQKGQITKSPSSSHSIKHEKRQVL
ncbi:hypothetical protein SK128_008521 [Halocaridina rubra]|uniref:Uncharacterized protein n=1 Tax=Halocaridina rubra TaxID=373956 RepID=A0AAN8X4Z6_HALRR